MKVDFSKWIRMSSLIVLLAMLLSSCGPWSIRASTDSTPTIEPWRVCAEEGVEAVLTAIKEADFETISSQSEGEYDSSCFVETSWENSIEIYKETFGELEWTIGNATIDADSLISVEVELTYADFGSAVEVVHANPKRMAEIYVPLVKILVPLISRSNGEKEYLNQFAEQLMVEMDKFLLRTSSTGTVVLRYNEELNTWTLESLPEVLRIYEDFYNNVDPVYDDEAKEEKYTYYLAAADILYEEEKIDYDQYYLLYEEYAKRAVLQADEVVDKINNHGFINYDTDEYVTSYFVGDQQITYYIDVKEPLRALILEFEFYKIDKPGTFGEGKLIMTGVSGICFWCTVPEGLERGTYGVIVRVSNGSIVIEDTIEVESQKSL